MSPVMTPEQFHSWSCWLQLPSETEALITAIRGSLPVRRVRGRTNNVTGRYPSPKMGCSIQFESHVEFLAIYAMERDNDVLEFYDQSSRIPLSYRARSGHKTTQWHTPDFFVLRRSSVGWEEWKQASSLDDLAVSMPTRYQQAGSGQWHCPSGDTYAAQFGLTYRLRSDAEYHPLEIQNLKFLQDFWAHDVPPHSEQEALVLAHIKAHPGIRLGELLQVYPDLSATLLTCHEQVILYGEEAEADQARRASSVPPKILFPGGELAWDGRLWQIEAMTDPVQLRPKVGEPPLLPLAEFQRLQADGLMWEVSQASPSPTTPGIREALLHASPKAQQEANRRLREILAYGRSEPVTASLRSVRRWWHAYQEAETRFGCGYLGLLDRVAQRGNRTVRIPEASMQLLQAHLQTHYAAPPAKSAAAVYRLYREKSEQQGIPPVSERTFYRIRTQFTTTDVIAARRGWRAAYASALFYWLDQTTPRHGERPFALAHLDHTELDIELISSMTGEPPGKPWATFLTDAYSRRILACYVTYDPPSYRSVMMVFRECVKRHQRLPQECMVDRGFEFGSVYFVTKKERPASQSRTGSVIERLFGTVTTQLLYQLLGNTQATKKPRLLTREVDPKRLAVWTLPRFGARLCQYVYEVYDQMDHPALGQSPREAFAKGMQLAGLRTHRLIPYSEEFLLLTCPTTRTGCAKLGRARGILVNGLRYSHPLMRSSQEVGTCVPVRYEPFDMSRAYAFVEGQWLPCTADAFLQVQGRSEREWELILSEWREHMQQHGRKQVTINGPLLTQFLEEIETEEQLLLQQQRNHEGVALREAIIGQFQMADFESSNDLQEMDEELDLATLPQYEEYC